MDYSSPRIRQRRMVRRRRFLQTLLLLIGVTVAVMLVWGVFEWGKSILIRKLIKTTTVSTGILQNTVPVSSVVLCDEELITANVGGIFYPVVAEGQRIRKGEPLGRLVSSAVSTSPVESMVIAPRTGLASFRIDGLEGLLTREGWERLDLGQLVIPKEGQKGPPENYVEPGRPLARVVDNLSDTDLGLEFAAQYLPVNTNGEPVGASNYLWIKLPDTEAEMARVVSLQKDSQRVRMVVELSGFREGLLSQRKVPVELITHRWVGFVLPREVLVFREDVPGLYVLRKGRITWKGVEIVGELGEEIVVKGLDEGTVVVITPHLVDEKMRIQ